jgi:hypothetical protein
VKKVLCIGIAGLALVAGITQAADIRPLTLEEQANLGATHEIRVTYADFAASTDTNTALIISNAVISSGRAVECVAMILEKAFDTENTNYTGSCALKVGDSSDDDLFLSSTEIASDGSEVLFKLGRRDAETITPVVTLGRVTVTDTNGVTFSAVTNVTVTATATAPAISGYKLYSADNYIKLTFTPNTEEALSANTAGIVRILFNIR